MQKCDYYFNYCYCSRYGSANNDKKVGMKSGWCLDWMCLPCDHLICLDCFRSRKPFLQSCYRCPSCGHQLPPSFMAFTWLVTHQQGAHDDEKGKMILPQLNKFNNIKAHICTYISTFFITFLSRCLEVHPLHLQT